MQTLFFLQNIKEGINIINLEMTIDDLKNSKQKK